MTGKMESVPLLLTPKAQITLTPKAQITEKWVGMFAFAHPSATNQPHPCQRERCRLGMQSVETTLSLCEGLLRGNTKYDVAANANSSPSPPN
jgi:hypothetical protein